MTIGIPSASRQATLHVQIPGSATPDTWFRLIAAQMGILSHRLHYFALIPKERRINIERLCAWTVLHRRNFLPCSRAHCGKSHPLDREAHRKCARLNKGTFGHCSAES